jgi:hypothetical protein
MINDWACLPVHTRAGNKPKKPTKLKKNHGFEPKKPTSSRRTFVPQTQNPWAVEKPIEHVFP